MFQRCFSRLSRNSFGLTFRFSSIRTVPTRLVALLILCLTYLLVPLQVASQTIGIQSYDPCGEPDFSQQPNSGVFVWRECNASIDNNWKLRVVGDADFQGELYSGSVSLFNDPRNPTSVTRTLLESHDTLNTSDLNNIRFGMRIWGANQDGIDFTSLPSSNVCLNFGGASDGEVYVGASRTQMTGPFELNSGGECISQQLVSIAVCGEPEIDPQTQTGPWLWRDCSCLLYTSPSPRDQRGSRMPSSA